MKQKIYLSLLLSIGLITACGNDNKPPTAVVTPTPTPTPIVVEPIITPTPQVQPPVPAATVPAKTPIVTVTPKALPPKVAIAPTTIYPTPTPVEIPVPAPPAKEPVKPTTKANSKPEPFTKLKAPTSPAQQITPVGIGAARIGMRFKELKQQMGRGFEFPVKTSFIEGFDAIAVTKAGAVQYYIPYPAGTNFTDEDRIEHLMTDNPNYRTEEGVGPGTPIDRAASVYGGATISLSKENESREFINFDRHPDGLAFRPKPAGSRTFAGEYPESNDEYLKTQKYDTRASIGQITVSCTEDKCGEEQAH
jgi:hypothetical protein